MWRIPPQLLLTWPPLRPQSLPIASPPRSSQQNLQLLLNPPNPASPLCLPMPCNKHMFLPLIIASLLLQAVWMVRSPNDQRPAVISCNYLPLSLSSISPLAFPCSIYPVVHFTSFRAGYLCWGVFPSSLCDIALRFGFTLRMFPIRLFLLLMV